MLAWVGIAALASIRPLVAASPDDPTSKLVLGALAKLNETPHHQHSSTTVAGAAGAAQEGEIISTGGIVYFTFHGKWKASSMTPKMWADQEQENIRNATVLTCTYELDEAVNGEATAVYKEHNESDVGTADAEIWISKTRGLPIREVIDLNGTRHMVVTIDYDNIQAPPTK